MRLVLMVVMLAGCSMYFGDDEVAPDAAVIAPPDASSPDATVCPPPGLPSCTTLPCGGDGQPQLDCPRPEDPSAPCHCPAPAQPGWCFPNQ